MKLFPGSLILFTLSLSTKYVVRQKNPSKLITEFGFKCIRSFNKNGEWSIYSSQFGAVIDDMSLTQSLHYLNLSIKEEPIFSMYAFSSDLIWFMEHDVPVKMNIYTIDYCRAHCSLLDLNIDYIKKQDSLWNTAFIFNISGSYSDDVKLNYVGKSDERL